MSGARKKVIVRELGGALSWGYLPGTGFVRSGTVDLLLTDGRAKAIPCNDLKHIAYVRYFNVDDGRNPERLEQRSFTSKPRGGGVWVRLEFVTGDSLEGLVPNGTALLDAVPDERGLFLEPPGRDVNTHRLFVPRTAITNFQVIGVAGSATSSRRRPSGVTTGQGDLFEA